MNTNKCALFNLVTCRDVSVSVWLPLFKLYDKFVHRWYWPLSLQYARRCMLLPVGSIVGPIAHPPTNALSQQSFLIHNKPHETNSSLDKLRIGENVSIGSPGSVKRAQVLTCRPPRSPAARCSDREGREEQRPWRTGISPCCGATVSRLDGDGRGGLKLLRVALALPGECSVLAVDQPRRFYLTLLGLFD